MDDRVLARVRALVEWAQEQRLTEFSFRDGEFRVAFRTCPRPVAAALAAAPAAADPATDGATVLAASTLPTINSPLVGIFYRSPSPDAPPFVDIGAWVSPDTVVGLVEAMKVFNEISAETSGRVVRILAESGQMVTSGQPLIEIEPGAERGRGR